MGFSASSLASQLGPGSCQGWVCAVGQLPAGREAAALGQCVARGDCGFPAGYCPEFASPRQDLQPRGSRGNLHGCDRKLLAIGFCSTSNLRKINGNIPLAKGWLGSRHTWVLASHSVCGSCQHLLTLTKSLHWLQQPPRHTRHRPGPVVRTKWLVQVIFH